MMAIKAKETWKQVVARFPWAESVDQGIEGWAQAHPVRRLVEWCVAHGAEMERAAIAEEADRAYAAAEADNAEHAAFDRMAEEDAGVQQYLDGVPLY